MKGPNLGEFSLNMPTHSCAHVALTVSATHTHTHTHTFYQKASSSVGGHAPAPVEVAIGYTNCSVWQPQVVWITEVAFAGFPVQHTSVSWCCFTLSEHLTLKSCGVIHKPSILNPGSYLATFPHPRLSHFSVWPLMPSLPPSLPPSNPPSLPPTLALSSSL